MSLSIEEILRRLENASETLDTEFKAWIDPASPAGEAKIAKGCMALRNNDGGIFVVGIYPTGVPDNDNIPPDARGTFHPDLIHKIINSYASEKFEVSVYYVDFEGAERVVIEIPSGVMTPVVSKRPSQKANPADPNEKVAIREDTVYVRTVESNNTSSSSPARAVGNDWPSLIARCFENREASIGAFVRRHLSSLDPKALIKAFSDIQDAFSDPGWEKATADYLEYAFGRFVDWQLNPSRLVDWTVNSPRRPQYTGSIREAAFVVSEFDDEAVNDTDFLSRLGATTQFFHGGTSLSGIIRGFGDRAVFEKGVGILYPARDQYLILPP